MTAEAGSRSASCWPSPEHRSLSFRSACGTVGPPESPASPCFSRPSCFPRRKPDIYGFGRHRRTTRRPGGRERRQLSSGRRSALGRAAFRLPGPHLGSLILISIPCWSFLPRKFPPPLPAEAGGDWIVRIRWAEHTADFHYRGIFAEHLARVAESTLRSVIHSPLPIASPKNAPPPPELSAFPASQIRFLSTEIFRTNILQFSSSVSKYTYGERLGKQRRRSAGRIQRGSQGVIGSRTQKCRATTPRSRTSSNCNFLAHPHRQRVSSPPPPTQNNHRKSFSSKPRLAHLDKKIADLS